jgi:hypothetical protein
VEGDAAAVAVAIGEVGGWAGEWGISSCRWCSREDKIREAEGGSDGDWGGVELMGDVMVVCCLAKL